MSQVCVVPSDCSRQHAAVVLKGSSKDTADRKGEKTTTKKRNETAEQSRRPLSLQRGYFKGMKESDALRGLNDPKVTTLSEQQDKRHISCSFSQFVCSDE